MSDSPNITVVDFITSPTQDLERSVAFYEGTLGLTKSVHMPERGFAEVETEPHITERKTFFSDGENLEPFPAPRFSRTSPSTPTPPGVPGVDTDAVLRDWV